MLNHVLRLLRREGVIEALGKSRSQRLVLEIVEHADYEHDCTAHEILEGHGAALGLCSNCLSPRRGVVEDLCPKCRTELESLDGDDRAAIVRGRAGRSRARPAPREGRRRSGV